MKKAGDVKLSRPRTVFAAVRSFKEQKKQQELDQLSLKGVGEPGESNGNRK